MLDPRYRRRSNGFCRSGEKLGSSDTRTVHFVTGSPDSELIVFRAGADAASSHTVVKRRD